MLFPRNSWYVAAVFVTLFSGCADGSDACYPGGGGVVAGWTEQAGHVETEAEAARKEVEILISRRINDFLGAVWFPAGISCLGFLVLVAVLMKKRWGRALALPVGPVPPLAGVLLFLVGYLSFLCLSVFFLVAFKQVSSDLSVPLTSIFAQMASVGLCIWLWCGRLSRPLEALGFHPRLAFRSGGFAVMVYLASLPAFFGLMDLSARIFTRELQTQVVEIALHDDPVIRGLYFLAVAIMAPFLEEVLFRGVLLTGLRRSLGGGGAVLVSSLVFMLVHPPVTYLPIFWLGLVLGFSFHYTGSIIAPLVIHFLHNGFTFCLILWAVSGQG